MTGTAATSSLEQVAASFVAVRRLLRALLFCDAGL
jgi:hypothetical protein